MASAALGLLPGAVVVALSHSTNVYGRMRAVHPTEKPVMRWILLLLALGAFALGFSTKAAGFMGFCLVVGFGALFAALFAFAAAKIDATSRPDSTLLADKDISALRASMRKPTTGRSPSAAEAMDGQERPPAS